MGLLDMLVPSSPGGGLLDFLKRNAALQAMPGMPGGDQAQYDAPAMAGPGAAMPGAGQPSPLDGARWPYGPVGAPSQANASMAAPAPSASAPVAAAPQMPAGQPAPIAPAAPAGNPVSGFLNRGADALASISHGGSLLGAVRGQYDDPRSGAAQANNVTAAAMRARGVDPAAIAAASQDPARMNELFKQTFGPPRAPTALGNGYIWQDGKIVRAYEPEDKIPVGFEKTKDGLRPIPGGPADPAYIRAQKQSETDPNAVKVLGKGGELYKVGADGQPIIVHKNEAGADATLSDESTKAMAAQYLSGDRTVLQNLGRGAQGAANIVKLREEITKQASAAGLSAKDIVTTFNEQAGNLAGQRTVGTRAANISLAANEANNMIPIAVAASEAVPRGQYVPINKAVQAIQTGSSSPELARFVAATNSLVNAYVRAVSPSGVPTDSMREHAYSMLNSAQSHDAYVAVTKIMQDEMKAALSAPEQVRKELRGEGSKSAAPVKVDGYTITEH